MNSQRYQSDVSLDMGRTKENKLRFKAGPLDIRAALMERKTAWRVPELTRLLSLGKHTLYDAIESGHLPATRIGTALRINPSDALTWYEAGTTGIRERPAPEEGGPRPRARRKGRKL
jgi:excisionase family DNA binding protein